jgi:hypothetical protein
MRNTGSNSSFVSIRYASSSKELPDANKNERGKVPVIDVETLRSIRRIVESIKRRIDQDERDRTGNDLQATRTRDSSSSQTDRSNSSQNPDGDKAENK